MANKGKRMLFEEDYDYLQNLVENHPDPSAEWGSSGGPTIAERLLATAADQTGFMRIYDEEDYADLVAGVRNSSTQLGYISGLSLAGDGTASLLTEDTVSLGLKNNANGRITISEDEIELRPKAAKNVVVRTTGSSALRIYDTEVPGYNEVLIDEFQVKVNSTGTNTTSYLGSNYTTYANSAGALTMAYDNTDNTFSIQNNKSGGIQTYSLPEKVAGTYTLATTADIDSVVGDIETLLAAL